MATVFLACRVLQSALESHLSAAGLEAVFLEYGLHRVPEQMAGTLQEKIDAVSEPSVIVLGYGLCGNGVLGLEARQHRLAIPRVDDCVALLLGSYKRYQEEFAAEPGTYYLTRGWLESGSHPLKEYQELTEKFDEETAAWVLDEQYGGYRRLLLVALSQDELESCRDSACAVAEFCAARWNMRYEERVGSSEFVRQLVTVAPKLEESTEDFLVITPGGKVRQELFFRPCRELDKAEDKGR